MIFVNFFFDFSSYSATPGGVLSQVGAAKAGGVEHTPIERVLSTDNQLLSTSCLSGGISHGVPLADFQRNRLRLL
jgi:hypothetical protein